MLRRQCVLEHRSAHHYRTVAEEALAAEMLARKHERWARAREALAYEQLETQRARFEAVAAERAAEVAKQAEEEAKAAVDAAAKAAKKAAEKAEAEAAAASSLNFVTKAPAPSVMSTIPRNTMKIAVTSNSVLCRFRNLCSADSRLSSASSSDADFLLCLW